jgi:hypothetical protein
MDILQNIRVFEDTAGPVRIQVYESALVESDLSIHIHGGSERCWLSPWLVPPGPMGEEGVGIRHPLLLAGGMVTPTSTPAVGTTTRRGPCICPRLELFMWLRVGLCMLRCQGLCMAEVSSGPGYRCRGWGFRFRFAGTNRVDSLRRAGHANSFWGRECEPAVSMRRRLIPGEEAVK